MKFSSSFDISQQDTTRICYSGTVRRYNLKTNKDENLEDTIWRKYWRNSKYLGNKHKKKLS